MATATATRTRKQPQRSARVQKVGNSVIVWLTVGKLATAYRVIPFPSQMGGVAFRLEKADQGDGNPEVYDVLLDGQRSLCSCKGFERFGMNAANGTGCKHVAGLQALRASLTAAGVEVVAPKPQPAPVSTVCEFDDP